MDSCKTPYDKKAVLLQGEPRDAAVNFNTYRILQRLSTCGFPATARLSCSSLSADCNASSVKNDKYQKEPVRLHI